MSYLRIKSKFEFQLTTMESRHRFCTLTAEAEMNQNLVNEQVLGTFRRLLYDVCDTISLP